MKETKLKKNTKKAAKTAPAKKTAKAAAVKEKAVVEKKEDVCKCECGCGCDCSCDCGCKCGCDCKCGCKKKMIDCYLDVISDYIKFNGRLSRRGYWSFVLFNFLFGTLCFIGDIIFHTYGVIFLTYGLLTLVPSYAAISRRLHDTNHNMLWGLFPLLIAPVLLKLVDYLPAEWIASCDFCLNTLILFVFVILVLSFVLMFFLLKRGCDGTNKYGDKPCC